MKQKVYSSVSGIIFLLAAVAVFVEHTLMENSKSTNIADYLMIAFFVVLAVASFVRKEFVLFGSGAIGIGLAAFLNSTAAGELVRDYAFYGLERFFDFYFGKVGMLFMTRRPFLGESAALFGGLSILLIVIGVIALVKKKVLAYVWFVPAVFVTVLQVLLWFFSRIGMHNVLSKDILLENQIIYIVNSVLIVAGLVFMGLWMKKKAK